MDSTRSRSWVFTINNPGVLAGSNLFPDALWLNYQHEKGENGTPHYQGHVVFKTVKSLKQLKKMQPTGHYEVRRGTAEQADMYVNKEETRIGGPWTFGEKPKQGRRSDLDSVREAIVDGAGILDVAENFFGTYLRYERSLTRYILLRTPQRDFHTEALVYWGPTGSGKSHHARELGGPGAFWLPKPRGQGAWWDGYTGQDTVVVDEFYGWLPLDMLLRLVDQYPLSVETKGGSVQFVAKRIIITSNKPPDMWYQKISPDAMPPALARRLTEPLGYVFYVGNNNQTEEDYRKELRQEGPVAFAGGYNPGHLE